MWSVVVLFVLGFIAKHTFDAVKEKEIIRARYQAFALAVRARDLNATRELLTPNNRHGLDDDFSILPNFAVPISEQHWISRRGNSAVVCPVAQYHYGFIRGGHTLDMVKIDGVWYATGGVHVD
jgi:hypothetical protein